MFFLKLSILLLLFSELRSSFKKRLEFIVVRLALEQVDLSLELIFFLLQLVYFFFQLGRVHRVRSEAHHVLVNSCVLGLKIAILLESVLHLVLMLVLIRNDVGHQELGGLGFLLEISHPRKHPVKDMLDRFLLSVDQFSLEGDRVV